MVPPFLFSMNTDLIKQQPHFARAFAQRAVDAKPGDPIRFIASTGNVARDGWVVDQSGWQLDNFRANPVFLWGHDYSGLPLGRCDVFVENDQLMADVTFDQSDEFARKVEGKYRNGFLNAVSVGWKTLEYTMPVNPKDPIRMTKNELLDISAVAVPGDPGALAERQARALSDISHEFSKRVDLLLSDNGNADDGDHDEAPWDDTAILMMRLFMPSLPMSERDRRRAYNRLAAQYRRAGKTAPEWLSVESLDPLGVAELRGLFLEGEPDLFPTLFTEQRAGAVLSSRNKNDLLEACRLIQGVVDRAEKAPPPQDEDTSDPNVVTDSENGGREAQPDPAPIAVDLSPLQLIRDSLSRISIGAN